MTENWTKASIPSFITLIRDKVQNYAKFDQQFKAMKNDGIKLATSFLGKSSSFSDTTTSTSSTTSIDVNLEKQLQSWKDNPIWTDPSPEIQVTVPKGSLCNLNVKVNVGLPPDAIYNIVTDPDNKRVFKNIEEVVSRRVLIDEGHRQVVELEQTALWRFLWWSGTITVHVLVDQNRKDYTMKFKQVKTGFMKRFEGCWKLEPLFVDEKVCYPFVPKNMEDYISCTRGKGRIGSKVSLEQLIQPALVPPPPISWYLRGITTKTTEMLITDLIEEASRIRSDYGSLNEDNVAPIDDCNLLKGKHDIKERWASRRRKRRRGFIV
ncbi:uncharacterized protein LOC124934323 [Impatiens glandulifera]|uniref:uncharacterized protein LOC124934323 n=1 Tax=Impatiens glandulifera TaxID=253017 RepID=UPI001FB133F4|nr:uncharacterized protein LOC124934323 [Impatiens glandulifera]XP_047330796.1 uncharacterized protein LOC124934323 [Impatiens glandulifera]